MGALRTFLTATLILEKLHIGFIICLEYQMVNLSSLVGNGEFTLESVHFLQKKSLTSSSLLHQDHTI